jgi:hypothetical protein
MKVKLQIFQRRCKRCGNMFETTCKCGKVCDNCLLPKGKGRKSK